MTVDTARWNHNIHYHPLILRTIPEGAQRALDIGCGEGMLARQLRQRIPDVTGIDPDATSIALAQAANGGIRYVQGDFLAHPFESASFDLVATVATLHHLDIVAALRRVQELLTPGGVFCAIGLASSRLPRDLPIELAGAVAHRIHRHSNGFWEHPSPILPTPAETYADVRRIARAELPGVRFRRHLLWRYSLTWTKPT